MDVFPAHLATLALNAGHSTTSTPTTTFALRSAETEKDSLWLVMTATTKTEMAALVTARSKQATAVLEDHRTQPTLAATSCQAHLFSPNQAKAT